MSKAPRLTFQDIKMIGDILNLALEKFEGKYPPTALKNAVDHFNQVFNKEMSWGEEELGL